MADMPEAEVDIDDHLVRSLLEDQHPDLADRPLRPVGFGWDNIVFRLGDDLAVRLPRRQMAAELVENEQRWLPVLAPDLTLAVPVPVRTGRPGRGYPWRWSVVAWMAGTDAATTPPLDPVRTAEVVGGFLRSLHRPAPIEAPRNPYRGIPLADREPILLAGLDSLTGLIDVAAVRASWDELVVTPPWSGPPLWLHGDLHPANLVVHDGEVVGVIDFGDLTSGDPATDLLVAWGLLPPEARPVLRAAAGGVDEDTWRRAKGWALAHAVACLASSANNPTIAGVGRRALAAVLTS